MFTAQAKCGKLEDLDRILPDTDAPPVPERELTPQEEEGIWSILAGLPPPEHPGTGE